MFNTKIQTPFFLTLLGGVLLLTFFIFKSYLGVMFLSGLFAIALYPFYRRILNWVGGRENVASILTVTLVFILILVPAIIIGVLLFQEAASLYLSLLGQSGNVLISSLTQTLQAKLQLISPNFTLDLQQYIQGTLSWLVGNLSGFFSSFVTICLDLFLLVFTLFYLFKNGDDILKVLKDISPLDYAYDTKIFQQATLAVNSMIRGSLVVGLLQGLLMGIGLYIFGVPNPILWGLVTAISSFVPILGSAVISIPAVLYLVFVGSFWPAVGLAIWGSTIIHIADNFVLPLIMKKSMAINPVLIILSILGGLSFFGPIGFLVGPIVLSFLFVLFDIYPLIFKSKQN